MLLLALPAFGPIASVVVVFAVFVEGGRASRGACERVGGGLAELDIPVGLRLQEG